MFGKDTKAEILIVEPDQKLGSRLKAVLAAENLVAELCQDPHQAIYRLRQGNFRLLIADIRSRGLSGTDLVVWTQHEHPDVHTLLITPDQADVLALGGLVQGAVMVLAEPLQLREFVRQVRLCLLPGLSADIRRVQLPDLLQIFALDPAGHVLELEDIASGSKGLLGICQQALCFARWYQGNDLALSGQDAFYQMLSVRHGVFRELPARDYHLQQLYSLPAALMQAATRMDQEMHAALTAGSAPDPLLFRAVTSVHLLSSAPQRIQGLTDILAELHLELEEAMLPDGTEPDTLLIYHLGPDTDARLIYRFCNSHPRIPVLLLAESEEIVTLELRQLAAAWAGLLRIFVLPPDLQAIRQLLLTASAQGYFGQLLHLSLLNQIQLFLMSCQRRKLLVKDLASGCSGCVYIENGRLIEAEFGLLRGQEAFDVLAGVGAGLVLETDWQTPVSRSLEGIEPYRLLLRLTPTPTELEDIQYLILRKVEASLEEVIKD